MGLLSRLMGWAGTSASSSYLVGIGDTYNATTSARESLPAVVRGITLLSGDIARVTARVVSRGGLEVEGHAAALLLGSDANPHMSGSEWRAWMVSEAIMHGTAYSLIQRTVDGEAVALWPIAPGRVQCAWDGQVPQYTIDGQLIDEYQLIGLLAGPGSPTHPYTCASPLSRCAPSLSLAVLQERVAASLAQAGRVGKISITHPGTLSTTAKLDLLTAYQAKHVSPEGASRPLVLDEGVKVERVGDGGAPGLIDDRRYAVIEVARVLGIPPQMLYQGDAGSLTSQVEMQRQYIDGSVAPWCARFASAVSRKLCAPGERVELAAHDLVRGNLRDTAASLKDLASTGALLVKDARSWLGLPPAPHGDSVVHRTAVPVEFDT